MSLIEFNDLMQATLYIEYAEKAFQVPTGLDHI